MQLILCFMLSVLEESALVAMIELFASVDLALIADSCSAAIIAPLPSVVILVLLSAVSYSWQTF